MKKLFVSLFLAIITLCTAFSIEGADATLQFKFDTNTTSYVDIGFTGNNVLSMDSNLAELKTVTLSQKETIENENKEKITVMQLPDDAVVNVYWRLLDPNNGDVYIASDCIMHSLNKDTIPVVISIENVPLEGGKNGQGILSASDDGKIVELLVYSHTRSLEADLGFRKMGIRTKGDVSGVSAGLYSVSISVIYRSV